MLEILFALATIVFGVTLWKCVLLAAMVASGRAIDSWAPLINGLSLAFMIWYVFVGGWG